MPIGKNLVNLPESDPAYAIAAGAGIYVVIRNDTGAGKYDFLRWQ